MNYDQHEAAMDTVGEKRQGLPEILEFAKAVVIGNVARLPIMTGLTLVAIDKWEATVFALQLLLDRENASVPGVDLGLLGWIGAIFLVGGIVLHLLLALLVWRRKNEKDVTIFFQNYSTLQLAQFQGELDRLFGMGDASIAAARNVLAHPDNPRGAFIRFRKCYAYVVADGNWLALRSKWHRLLYWLGNLFALLVCLNALLCFVAAAAEFWQPGILGSGKRAGAIMVTLVVTNLIGLYLLTVDLVRRGTASTLLLMRP